MARRSVVTACRRGIVGLALAAAAMAAPPAARAQKVLVSYTPAGATESVIQLYDYATARVEWSRPGGLGPNGAVLTSDGRYALTGASPVRVIDVASGSSFDGPASFEPRVAHPRATAIYGLTGGSLTFGVMAKGTLARLDLNGMTVYGGCPPGTTSAVDLSGNGRLVFALCDSGDLAVLDTGSGAVLRTVPVGQGVTFAATFDGAAVVVARPTIGGSLDLLDSTTGAALGSTVVPGSTSCAPWVHRASSDRTTLIVSCSTPGAPLPTWSSQVLTVPSLTWGATLGGVNLQVRSISPENHLVFSTYAHRLGTFGWVQVSDVASGATVLTVPIIASLAVGYAPLAPTASATVSGRRVDFQRAPPAHSPAATRYVVEVGSAPGSTDITTFDAGVAPTLTVPAAPPGRYYVRVRAENVSGRSAPSSDIVVDVP